MDIAGVRRLLRLFIADKNYSILNIVGLSVGMACAILLVLYLEHELTFDRHNVEHQNIYRVNHQIDATNNITLHAQTSHFLGPLLTRDYPQIENYVSFRRESPNATLLKFEDAAFYVNDLYIADNSVFEIFTHEIVFGEASSALTRPNSIAINQSLSNRLFGSENPVGLTLTTGVVDYEVTLVFADLPANTHFKYSALIANAGNFAPTADDLANRRGSLWNLNGYTYLQMNPATPIDGEEVFNDFFDRQMADVTRPGYTAQFFLEPLSGIHLNSVALQDESRGNTYYLYALSIVAILVLAMACFNYINLATARAISRSKDIVMRKILGADKRALITQFIVESILYAFIALVLALLLVELFLVASADINLFGREFESGFWQESWMAFSLMALGLLVGLMAGIYPALYVTTMDQTRNTQVKSTSSVSKVRGVLVLAQFTISIAVISATLLMFNQLTYMDGLAIGLEKENKLIVRVQGADAIERIPGFQEELRSSPYIDEVSLAVGNPVTGNFVAALEAQRADGSVYNLEYSNTWVDETYLDALGMQLTRGRGFLTGQEAELRQVVINQAATAEIGWEDPIGKVFTIGGGPEFTVIGEVQDFRFEDIRNPIKPFVFYYDQPDFTEWSQDRRVAAMRELIVAINSNNVPEALAFLEQAWLEFDSVYPLQYEFLEDVMEQLRVSDNRQINLVALFAVFCVLISCLGLFGLTAFTTQRKTKEIGIRKTLGASTQQIINLLFSNIFKLLLVASFLASIVAYLAISGWLEGFYYREVINPMAFIVAALLSIIIAFVTLTIQSYRTASQNPVIALRYE